MSGPKTYSYSISGDAYVSDTYFVAPGPSQEEIRREKLNEQRTVLELKNLLSQAREIDEQIVGKLKNLHDRPGSPPVLEQDVGAEALRLYLELGIEYLDVLKKTQNRQYQDRAERSIGDILQVKDTELPGDVQLSADVLPALSGEPGPEYVQESEDDDRLGEMRKHAQELLNRFIEQHDVLFPSEIDEGYQQVLEESDPVIISTRVGQLGRQLDKFERKLEQESGEAKSLLHQFPEDMPPQLKDTAKDWREYLVRVANGRTRLGKEEKFQVEQFLTETRKVRAKAASGILMSVLSDLGYEAEPIDETLFVEGGEIYLRRSVWDTPYYVRMRVDSENPEVNFNVVRVDESRTTEQDTQMERDWCVQLEYFEKAVRNRGLTIKRQRALDAGIAPVQEIKLNKLDSEFWEGRLRSQESQGQSTQNRETEMRNQDE